MSQLDTAVQNVLDRITAYCAARTLLPTTFGMYAVGDRTFVERLERGKVTFAIAKRALDYIAAQEGSSSPQGDSPAKASAQAAGSGSGTGQGGTGSSSPQGDSPSVNGTSADDKAADRQPSPQTLVA